MWINGSGAPLSIGRQIWNMQRQFPDFEFRHKGMSWYGSLQPTDESPRYRIKVTYRLPNSPQVWVLQPAIAADAKHRYRNQSLCLHYPRDGDWQPGFFLADTILPWTAEWLYYYELWQIDPEHRWLGPEASHSPRKRYIR